MADGMADRTANGMADWMADGMANRMAVGIADGMANAMTDGRWDNRVKQNEMKGTGGQMGRSAIR